MQTRHLTTVLLALSGAPAALAQNTPVAPPVFPEGVNIPRRMTDAEKAWVAQNPITASGMGERAASTPVGPVHCVAEYEPMDAIIIAWEGDSTWNAIQRQMVEQITTTGDADVWISVDSTSERTGVQSYLASSSADLSRIKYVVRTTDTVWIRDYGPRYIYEGDVRAIVDHTYNRPRPNDNAWSAYFGNTVRKQKVYSIPLVHGGGNYHLNALNEGHATRLISNENPSLTDTQIRNLWQTYQNVNTTLQAPFPTSVDVTQHIDMWMQIVGDRKVIISDWPAQPGTTQDTICDNVAASLAAAGWTVHRVPARSVGGTHYTYTNVVMCNDLVLIPTYTNTTIANAGYNAQALATWQNALPGKTIVQVNCQALVTFAGVMHCIVMHVPAHKGGVNPTAYLQTPNGGGSYNPGQTVEIGWISDDDDQAVTAEIRLSTDGGATYPIVVAASTPDDGSFNWTVPDVYTTNAKIKVTVKDAQNNTGFDVSDAVFAINGTPPACPADYNGDAGADILDFLDFMDDFGACQNQPSPCGTIGNADVNGDNVVDILDFLDFIDAFGQGC